MNAGVPPPSWREPVTQLPTSKIADISGEIIKKENSEIDYSEDPNKRQDDEPYSEDWNYQEE